MQSAAKHAVVIGAGLSGLAAARDLLKRGWRVTLIDASTAPGGIASSFLRDGTPIERYYHFICRPDHDLAQLSRELGLEEKVHWVPTRTTYFYQGKLYGFSSPFDLLTFPPVPFLQRLRFGINVLVSRYRSGWRDLDGISAQEWLTKWIGKQAYEVIWQPLLRVKFGEFAGQVSAAWIWHRIWRVARSRKGMAEPEKLGYFEGGSETLVRALWNEISAQPGACIRMGTAVQAIHTLDGGVQEVITPAEAIACDAVISTVALPVMDQLLPGMEGEYFSRARQIRYIGLVCMLVFLDRAFSPAFWTNVFDPRIHFNGIIEYTNLNQHLNRAGTHILYIPYYLPVESKHFSMSDEELLEEYMVSLKQINPAFERSWVKDVRVFREHYAQAICTTGFSEMVLPVRSPLRGLYVTDSTQFYPEDRSLSAAVRTGRKAAELLCQDFGD
jgi:protoporphyrinogen oxidase